MPFEEEKLEDIQTIVIEPGGKVSVYKFVKGEVPKVRELDVETLALPPLDPKSISASPETDRVFISFYHPKTCKYDPERKLLECW